MKTYKKLFIELKDYPELFIILGLIIFMWSIVFVQLISTAPFAYIATIIISFAVTPIVYGIGIFLFKRIM